MTLQVVNLGLPKSGTTTLARAFKRAGYRVADHRVRDPQGEPGKQRLVFVAELLYRGYFETGDPAALLPGFTAVSEMSMLRGKRSLWPQMDFALLEAVRRKNPGLKFVASRRDAAALSASMMAWNNLGTTRLPSRDIPGLPAGYGVSNAEQERWIDGHYDSLLHWFRDDPDYLELDIAAPDARERLSSHLGRDLPWWGKANTNRTAQAAGSS